MALESQQGIVASHSAAVVGNPDENAPTRAQLGADLLGTGVKGVLDELLEHRRRPLDDLSGGDLIRHTIREYANLAHLPNLHRNAKRASLATRLLHGCISMAISRHCRNSDSPEGWHGRAFEAWDKG